MFPERRQSFTLAMYIVLEDTSQSLESLASTVDTRAGADIYGGSCTRHSGERWEGSVKPLQAGQYPGLQLAEHIIIGSLAVGDTKGGN